MTAAGLASALGVDRSTGWRLARSLEQVGWLRQDRCHGPLPPGDPAVRARDAGPRHHRRPRRGPAGHDRTGRLDRRERRPRDPRRRQRRLHRQDRRDHEVRAFTRSGQRARFMRPPPGRCSWPRCAEAAVRSYLAGPLAALHPGDEHRPASLARGHRRDAAPRLGDQPRRVAPRGRALAVPVLDASAACVAALGLNVPLSRLDDDRVRVLVGELAGATKRLTRRSVSMPARRASPGVTAAGPA